MKLAALSGYLKGTIFDIEKEHITIGRKEDQDICILKDVKISRYHCELKKKSGKYTLLDLNSGNGTWYKGKRVDSVEIKEGDSFIAGDTEFSLLAEVEKIEFLLDEELAPLNVSTIISSDFYESEKDVDALKTHLHVFQEVSKSLVGKLDMKSFLEATVESVITAVKAERAFVLMVDENKKFSSPIIVKNYSSNILVSETILKKCINEQKIVLFDDSENYDEFKHSESLHKSATKVAACVPIVYNDNVVAIIYLDATENAFTPKDISLIVAITNQASLAIKNIKLYEEVETKHKELQNAQKHLIKAEKLSIVGTLAASISHDMKNILTPILGVSSIVLNNQNIDPVLREAFERQIERLQSLTFQLLSLVSSQPIAFIPGDLNEKLKDSLRLLKTESQYQKVTIETCFKEKNIVVRADLKRLDQVFINLCLNAIQALSGQEKAKLIVSTKDQGDYAEVTFSDNGPGIREEYLKLIFEPFFTTKVNGSGMGLFSCKKIIEKDHKGKIEVHSSIGEGTSFVVQIPKNMS